MTSHRMFCLGAAVVVLTLGCGTGDLTLPGPGQGGPAQPAALKVLSGDGQQAEVGTVLDDPLTVQVLGDSSQPMPNIQVQFSFLGDISGAAVDPASIETDEAGRAATIVRRGERPREQVIVAAGCNKQQPGLRARFSATAVLPGDNNGGKGGHGGDGDGD